MITNKEVLRSTDTEFKRENFIEKIFFGNFELWTKIMSGAKFDPLLRNKRVIEKKQKNN